MSEKHLTSQKFTDLNLVESLVQGIKQAGFEYCTPIQAQSLPHALEGKDVAGQAQTGTGKTVAFLLACCQYLIRHPADPSKRPAQICALILAPTRELAIQIHKDAQAITKHTDLKLGLVYGGTGYEQQKRTLAAGLDVLIGTPGRLIDFYKQNLFGLKYVQVAILDEADRMFDLGFIKDIRYLLRRMPEPERRLNMLYSATLSFRVMELAYEHMNDPVEVKIDADVRVADKISEFCFYPSDDEKPALLINLLKSDRIERALVFVNTKHGVETVSNYLSKNEISNAALSGDVLQKKREKLLEGFKTGQHRILVATDVAARGLHIPKVSHVFNYDLPQDAQDYVHRIGRTARAGQSGEAISFLCEKYAYSIMDIEEYIGHAIPKTAIEPWMVEPVLAPAPGEYASQKRPKRDRKQPRNAKKPRTTAHSDQPQYSPATSEQTTATNTHNISKSKQQLGKQPRQSGTEAKQKTAEPKPKTKSEDFPLPKNRFSRKFGEIPLVG